MPDIFSSLHHLLSGDDASAHHTATDHHTEHGVTFQHDQIAHDHVDASGDQADVPWLNFSPHDTHAGVQHGDAVHNAAHAASGSSDLPVGAFSSGVPWQQITPDAMHHDTDGDGVPDALDNHVGYGKE